MIPGLNSANISGAEERLRCRQRELRDHRSKPRRRSSEKGQHHLEDPGTYRDQQWEYLAARTRYQLRRLAHSCEIAADVDRVCAEQQRHEGCYGPGRIDPAHAARNSASRATRPGSTAASRGTTSSIACQASAHLLAGSYPAGIIVGFANDPP